MIQTLKQKNWPIRTVHFFGLLLSLFCWRLATRVSVLLFVCVVVLLHINAVGVSFRKISPVGMHFSSTCFLFFPCFYLQNSCRFSLPFMLILDVVVGLLIAGCCCGVLWRVVFVITVMFCYCNSLLRFAVVVYCCGFLLWFVVVVWRRIVWVHWGSSSHTNNVALWARECFVCFLFLLLLFFSFSSYYFFMFCFRSVAHC